MTFTANSQCNISTPTEGTTVGSGATVTWGQGFIAECDGNLEYVQLIAGDTGVVSGGTLNIYNGNSVSGTPIYTQLHPSITIDNIGDPVRVNINNTLNLIENNQYTFQFTIDGIGIKVDFSGAYSGGSAFENNGEFSGINLAFEVSVLDPALSTNDITQKENVQIFPNPSSDFIQVSGLSAKENYKIFNILGAEVKTGVTSNQERIDIKNLTNGLYFLRFDNRNSLKFIKQ